MPEPYAVPYISYLLGLGLGLLTAGATATEEKPNLAIVCVSRTLTLQSGRVPCRAKVYLLPARARTRALMAVATVPPATACFFGTARH